MKVDKALNKLYLCGMLDFLFKTISFAESGFFQEYTDWHCHVLPGVDDGIKNIEDSLAVLDNYERAGIREVWFTPHIMEDIPNTTASLRQVFTNLQVAYKGSLRLHLASENMLDSLFDERLASGDLLPYDGHRLLVETSYFNPPMDLHGIFKRIQSAGFHPVLAHPERYMYMDFREYQTLRANGVFFQINIPSLYGAYGPDVQAKSMKLLSSGMYDVTGTDIHRTLSLQHILEADLRPKVFRKLEELK